MMMKQPVVCRVHLVPARDFQVDGLAVNGEAVALENASWNAMAGDSLCGRTIVVWRQQAGVVRRWPRAAASRKFSGRDPSV